MRRLPTLLVLLLVLALAVAGCGGDDDKSSDKSSSETATQAETSKDSTTDEAATDKAEKTETDAAADKADEDGSSSSKPKARSAPEIRKQVVDDCRKSADKTPNVSAETKQRLKSICDQATDSDQPSTEELSREICLGQVESSGLTGASAEAARKQCESIGK
jgi:hypothetical protein